MSCNCCDGHCCRNEEHHKHNKYLKLFCLVVSLALFVTALILKLTGASEAAADILFIFSAVLSGYEVVFSALKNIIKGDFFDENLLMTVAAIGAVCIGEFPEAAAVMLLFEIGESAQEAAVNRSKKSIKDLMDIRADFARIIVNGEYKTISPEKVCVGEVIEVRAGEKIPLDGVVLSGVADMDTAALTGEAAVKHVTAGDEVISGCINTNGILKITVSKNLEDSTVTRILKLVEEAEHNKPKTQRFITRFAKIYTPCVMLLALAVALVPPLLFSQSFSQWTYNALVLLVISCPCALVISVPLGYLCGMGAASKTGILFKNGTVIDNLYKVTSVVFDKTGTLTNGEFKILEVLTQEEYSEQEIIDWAAAAEVGSSHPIARAILAAGTDVQADELSDYTEYAGKGVSVKYKGNDVLAGNEELMRSRGVVCDFIRVPGTEVYVALNGKLIGTIVVGDAIKAGAADVISDMRKLGFIKCTMLTGDTASAALNVKEQLGLDECYSDLLPSDKVGYLKKFKHEAGTKSGIMFVGDGINDAPVITSADVGVAMGALGSDAAIEASDLVIMDDNLSKLPKAVTVARKTKGIIYQNIFFALAFKAIVMALGIFGVASMWMAVFADVGVCLITVLNSLRIFINTK